MALRCWVSHSFADALYLRLLFFVFFYRLRVFLFYF